MRPSLSSPLEARKQELSEELRRLKARLNPTAPPPRAPPAALYSPAGRRDGADGHAGTPATQAAAPPAPLPPPAPLAPAPPAPPPAPPALLSADEVEASAAYGTLSPGKRSSALSGLEESQRMLEDKLAALKRKLQQEA